MTNAGFPTRHEDRTLPLLISASVAAGAAMLVMIGLLTVTSGAAMRSETAVAGTAIDSANAMGRSGTLLAQQIVF